MEIEKTDIEGGEQQYREVITTYENFDISTINSEINRLREKIAELEAMKVEAKKL